MVGDVIDARDRFRPPKVWTEEEIEAEMQKMFKELVDGDLQDDRRLDRDDVWGK